MADAQITQNTQTQNVENELEFVVVENDLSTQFTQTGLVILDKPELVDLKEEVVKKVEKRSRKWFFTFNNYTDLDITQLTQIFESYQVKYVFQEELGAVGTPHLQGYVDFREAKTFNTMKKINDKIHWEIVRNAKASKAYCQKLNTRNGRVFTNIEEVKPIAPLKDPMVGKIRKDWQIQLDKEILEEPDDRKIVWCWEEKGAVGKTMYSKSICMANPKTCLYLTGKSNDIKFVITTHLKAGNELKIVFMDLCRSNEEYVSYEAIEAVKNGIFCSGKYEGSMVIFNQPHVIIFANFKPPEYKLSSDKWDIRYIGVGDYIKGEIKDDLPEIFTEGGAQNGAPDLLV